MVHSATNRQPTNVIPNVLLRLQARKKNGDIHKASNTISSRISKEFHEIGTTSNNTTMSHTFISNRMSSWQSHLVHISPFLLPGRNVWWQETKDGYEFLDGTYEPESHAMGPHLFHFCSKTLEMVYKEKKLVFQQLIHQQVDLPTPYIKLYSHDGKYIGIRKFNEQGTVEIANGEMEDEVERDKMAEVVNGDENEQVEDEAETDHNIQIMVEEEYRDKTGQMEDERDKTVEVVNGDENEQIEDEEERDHNTQIIMEEEYGDENGQMEDERDEMVEVVNGDENEQIEDEAERDHNMQIMMEEDYGDGNWQMEERLEMVKVVNGDEIEQVKDEGGRDQNRHTMVNVANTDANDQQVEDETERDQNRQLKTKLCVAILKALGKDRLDLILTLDGIRHKLKHENSTEETLST